MEEALLTTLSMEKCHSNDSGSLSHDELERELNRTFVLSRPPPDINLPLSSEPSPPSQGWNDPCCDSLEVGLVVGSGGSHHLYESEAATSHPKPSSAAGAAKKCAKRLDSVWGAWVFFSFYFKPVLNEKSKCKIVRDGNGISGFEKSDLQLDAFLVQHDMENMYMWVFKERPENALGKMQLRSYMNGHSRQGERPFPFSADRGFVRSHRMQRKHYRGLSNPQCIHGVELVRSPNLTCLDEDERKRWVELTGRDINFTIPIEASDFGSWRNLQQHHHHQTPELELAAVKTNNNHHHHHHHQQRKLLNGTSLNLATQPSDQHATVGAVMMINGGDEELSPVSNKRKKDLLFSDDCSPFDRTLDLKVHGGAVVEPIHHHQPWAGEFSGVMKAADGPVTGAKTIYEDEEGFLIVVSLPFADIQRVKVTWKNTPSHGVVKIVCVSTAGMQFIKRRERTFKLTDPSPEHCPPGEFVREISLPTRIPEDGKLEAYCDETGTVLEIIVPKHRVGPEEHEVRVCLRPSPWNERPYVDLKEADIDMRM